MDQLGHENRPLLKRLRSCVMKPPVSFSREQPLVVTMPLFYSQPDEDIRRFLISKFEKIKANYPLALHLPASWPPVLKVEDLVRKSSGQFIYASTVIKIPRHRPTDRLDVIFGQKLPGKQVPFAELDALYWLIFSSAEDIEAVLEVFAFLLLPKRIGNGSYIPEFILGYQSLQIILADLHSVIFVPCPRNEFLTLRIFHASLGDFLLDESRSGNFFIDAPKAHARMAEICIQHTIPILKTGDKLKIDEQTRYLDQACKNLMTECSNAYPTEELLHQLNPFRFDQLLFLSSEYLGFGTNLWQVIMASLPGFIHWLQQQV
ncbi:hypothetical protein BYT27DRAFT_6886952 [Phlegmacium glaucopus]|nr:hypothetical protein BYT27DRAFT_6886952 [Phlegmacium glaucopus]